MAGHSKFANIKHRKAAQDSKRTKLFSKAAKELIVAAKAGSDPDGNARLRSAIIAAKAVNLPRDRIEYAIKKGSGNLEANNYEEIRYEAYGPAGSAFVIECLTDSRNRAAAAIRSLFTKHGGSLAENGSVIFMFEHKGVVRFNKAVASDDDIFEEAVLLGADSVESDDELHEIQTEINGYTAIRDSLIEKYGDPVSAAIEWLAKDNIDIDASKSDTMLKVIDLLEEDDDVQSFYTNANIPEEEGE
ncbi:MAG: YebC/PmpR family DNA-binding transcriptional regulator [Rickettsiales bacterium]|jgi:YebC/PmpR family DNA-binding regulatory protein|nr:YebC/PmpR family DNA-binding transcriptional regulator [Rickettsiales bacterium]